MIDLLQFDMGQMRGYTYRDSFMSMLRTQVDGFVTPSGHILSVCVGDYSITDKVILQITISLIDDFLLIDTILDRLVASIEQDDRTPVLDSVMVDLMKHVIYYAVSVLRQLKIRDVLPNKDVVLMQVFVHSNKIEIALRIGSLVNIYRIEPPTNRSPV